MKRAFTLLELIIVVVIFATLVFVVVTSITGCEREPGAQPQAPRSASGVRQATAEVQADPTTGLTVEQANIKRRLENDNKPGAIKHLYIISPISGDVLVYSAVKGKVTSGGKRLTPTTVAAGYAGRGDYAGDYYGSKVSIGGTAYRTSEIIQDDGTYGSSSDYIYWWDTKGIYRQVGVVGCLWIVSDQPLQVGKAAIVIDTE